MDWLCFKAWMEAPLTACAPNNDLHLPKTLVKYENINTKISKAVSTKLASHMWYLSKELVRLALFDRNVSNSMKQKIIQGLTNEGYDDPPKKVQINIQTINDCELNDFVISTSKVIIYYPKTKHPNQQWCQSLLSIGGIISNFTPILHYFQHYGDEPRPRFCSGVEI